jgi:anti-anti-sigma regulatory factor
VFIEKTSGAGIMSHIITIPPRLDMQTAALLNHDWLDIFPQHEEIIFECSHLQQISTAGAQLLIASKQYLGNHNKKLNIRNLSEAVKYDLTTLGLNQFFN